MMTVISVMITRPIKAARLLTLVACCYAPIGIAQSESEPQELAESQRLAHASLLLDITTTSDGGVVAVGERGHVVYSADGENWTQADLVPTRSTLTSVASSGDTLWAAGHDSVILSSEDDGRTWTIRYRDVERQQPVMDIYFIDGQKGFAIGAYGLMLATLDGGENWEERFPSPDEWHLNAILDLGDDRLLIAAEAGFSYLSEDGGETWDEITMPYPGSMFGAVDRGDGCVLSIGLRGHVQESCDGGRSWVELETPTESSLGDGVTVQGITLLVGNSGALLERGEDGDFRVTYHSSGTDFAGVVAVNGGFLIVGEDGVHRYPEAENASP
jgi:photosystem II stability/assembly factor-like uncharacterized protein